VILYTGFAEGISEAQLAASGVRVLMRKPIEPAELRAKLVEFLGAGPAAAVAARAPGARKAAARKVAAGKKSRAKAAPRKTARRAVAASRRPSRR